MWLALQALPQQRYHERKQEWHMWFAVQGLVQTRVPCISSNKDGLCGLQFRAGVAAQKVACISANEVDTCGLQCMIAAKKRVPCSWPQWSWCSQLGSSTTRRQSHCHTTAPGPTAGEESPVWTLPGPASTQARASPCEDCSWEAPLPAQSDFCLMARKFII